MPHHEWPRRDRAPLGLEQHERLPVGRRRAGLPVAGQGRARPVVDANAHHPRRPRAGPAAGAVALLGAQLRQAPHARVSIPIDSGPLYAAIDEDDLDHDACLELLLSHPGPLLVPELVITEVAYLVATRLGVSAEVRFSGDLATGTLIAEPVHAADWQRIPALVAS